MMTINPAFLYMYLQNPIIYTKKTNSHKHQMEHCSKTVQVAEK